MRAHVFRWCFFLLVAVCAVAGTLSHATVATAATDANASLVVKVVAGLTPAEEAAIIARNGGTETSAVPALRLHVISVAAVDLALVQQKYQADPQVQSVELNKTRKVEAVPADANYGVQWALSKIGWDSVYDEVEPAGSSLVAVLDTGVDGTHPDLSGTVVAGTSILDGGQGVTDPNGHGTWLAGVVAAVTGNDVGIAGVAYQGVKVMPVTVLDSTGSGKDSDIISGIVWAVDHGADVILMGFSNSDFSQNLQDAIDYAWSKGAVLVAATGNSGVSTPTFPAGNRGVVGVSATDETDLLASISNYGTDTFLAAPGTNIFTTSLDNTYTYISGTSGSSAIIAGVAAFMKAVDPTLTNGVIVGRLAKSADAIGTAGDPNNQAMFGNGRVNMAGALAATSTDFIQPAGVDAQGGPYVGPYVAAATRAVTGISLGAQSTPHPVALVGGTASYTVTVTSVGSNSGGQVTAAIGITNLPAGVSVTSITPSSVTLTNSSQTAQATLVLAVSGGVPAGTSSSFTVSATGWSAQTTGAVIVDKAAQAQLFVVPSGPPIYNTPVTLSTTGGSGSGAVSYSVLSGNCTIAGDQLTANSGAGNCIVTAAKAGDSLFSAATSAPLTLSMQPASQAALSVSAPESLTYLASATLSTTGGSGSGAISYNATGSCTIVGSQVTAMSGSGSCMITATKLGDVNFTSITSAPVFITLQPAQQATLNLNAPASLTYNNSATLSSTGGSGSGAVSYGVTSGDCTIVKDQLTANKGTGVCIVTATKGADLNYSATTSAPITVSLQPGEQAALSVNAPANLIYNASAALSATGGSGSGLVTYNVASGNCSIVGGQLTANKGTGICTVTATKAADEDYLAKTSAAATVTLQPAAQEPLILTAPTALAYNTSATLSSTGGSGTGTVTYNGSGNCSIAGDQITATSGTGICTVTATKAADDDYTAKTSDAATVILQLAPQAALTVNVPETLTYGTMTTLTYTGGSGLGAVSYSVTAGSCTLSGNQLTATSGTGTCTVTATKGADLNYSSRTSEPATVTLQLAPQAALDVTAPATLVYNGSATLGTTGGNGTGVVSYSVTSGSCILSGDQLTATSGTGSCTVTATKGSDLNYSSKTSDPVTITLQLAPQAPLTVTAPNTLTYLAGTTLSATGGSGTGAVSYSVTSGNCSISGNVLTANSGSGTCTVTATRSTDGNYSAKTSDAAIVNLQPAAQASLTVNVPATLVYNTSATLGTTGGSGTGAVTYTVTGSCELAGNLLTAKSGTGSCNVTATKAADENYTAKTSIPVTVTLQKANPTVTFTGAPANAEYTKGFTVSSTCNSTALPVYTSSGPCSNSGTAYTMTNSTGTCTATVTWQADSNYNWAALTQMTSAAPVTNGDIAYTGLTDYATASTNSTSVTVSSSASVNVTVGDITKAQVIFTATPLGGGAAQTCTANVGRISGTSGGTQIGSASCTWPGSTGNQGGQTYTVTSRLAGSYAGASDSGTVDVHQPAQTNFISGGGFVMLGANEAGVYKGAAGSKGTFGANVKYNKGGSNLQGNVNIILRNGTKQYQFKSTSLLQLTVATPTGSPASATFTSKGVGQTWDASNPSVVTSLGGNWTIQIQMHDVAEPGAGKDTIGVTVWDGSGALVFSNNSSGGITVEQTIGGGNLQVH